MAISVEAYRKGIQQKAYIRLLKAAAVLTRNLKRRVGISNRKGWEPSQPGQSPRRSQFGLLQRSIRFAGNNKDAVRVGVGKEAEYGLFLELGTISHRVRPRTKRFLMIPILRRLSPREVKELGAKKVVLQSTGRKEWVIWRTMVTVRGIRPRPWLVPGLRESMAAMRAVIQLPG